MTTMDVPETERGHARIFAVELAGEEAAAFDDPEIIARALGIEDLPHGQYEYFPVSNLDGLGLAGYLTEGLGIATESVRADRARLNAVRGHVLIVLSAGVRGRTLRPVSPLRWIGTYAEPVTIAPMEKLRSESAEGLIGDPKPRPSDAAMSGRIAMLALLVLLLLVILMVVIA
ncbi:hypothetical protein [Roseisalinus antarcticus]|uniref:Uncharacterized protein n=1 Tax=Roseisalinus antarcticus TaxID=254357 RepID=A0A1Y5RNF2_9RHOB|nr:hypothetical protein [Roseisalinus antarcticus]SLN21683.1 hypothetical protein ROA7023_00582 [Roseisalinus antarcticus]